MKTWVRVLLIGLLAIVVLAVVAVAAFRIGFQAGVNQQVATSEFDGRTPLGMWGGQDAGSSGFRDGPRGRFPMLGGFHPMRHWGFGFFYPGMFLGLIFLGLVVFLLIKASPATAAKQPTRTRRRNG